MNNRQFSERTILSATATAAIMHQCNHGEQKGHYTGGAAVLQRLIWEKKNYLGTWHKAASNFKDLQNTRLYQFHFQEHFLFK